MVWHNVGLSLTSLELEWNHPGCFDRESPCLSTADGLIILTRLSDLVIL